MQPKRFFFILSWGKSKGIILAIGVFLFVIVNECLSFLTSSTNLKKCFLQSVADILLLQLSKVQIK